MRKIFLFFITLLLLCLCFSVTAFADDDNNNNKNTSDVISQEFSDFQAKQDADKKAQIEYYISRLKEEINFFETTKADGCTATFKEFVETNRKNGSSVNININKFYDNFFNSEDAVNTIFYLEHIKEAKNLINNTSLDYSSATLSEVTNIYNYIIQTKSSALMAYGWYNDHVTGSNSETLLEKIVHFFTNNALSTIKSIGTNIKGSFDTEHFGIDYTNPFLYALFYKSITAFANCLLVIFIGLGVIKSGLQYDLFTARGGVKIIGGLILGKLLVDKSISISINIISVINNLAAQLISNTSATIDSVNITVDTSNFVYSNNKYIGEVINFFNNFGILLWSILICLILLIISAIVLVKLMLRSFELSLLVAVSPCFMACASSEATRPYFTKFLTTLISVTANIVFMALVYTMFGAYLSSNGSSFTIDSNGFGDWIIVIIAMGIAMVKPPKILTNLIS